MSIEDLVGLKDAWMNRIRVAIARHHGVAALQSDLNRVYCKYRVQHRNQHISSRNITDDGITAVYSCSECLAAGLDILDIIWKLEDEYLQSYKNMITESQFEASNEASLALTSHNCPQKDAYASVLPFPLNEIQKVATDAFCKTASNMILQAPTGSGKTAVAVIAIQHALHIINGRMKNTDRYNARDPCVFYVAPTKSLILEKLEEIKRLLPEITVYPLSTDFPRIPKETLMKAHVLLGTPESFNIYTRHIERINAQNLKRTAHRYKLRHFSRFSVLRNSFKKLQSQLSSNHVTKQCQAPSLALVILDEVHILDTDRGPELSAAILRISSSTRILAMSATISHISALATFLSVPPETLLNYSPTGHRYVTHIAACKPEIYQVLSRYAISAVPTIVFVQSRRLAEDIAVWAATQRAGERRCPGISKVTDAASTARSSQERQDPWPVKVDSVLTDSVATHALTKANSIIQSLPALVSQALLTVLPHGSAFHHAGLTANDRRVVETAFKQGIATFLVATATLLMGVNTPCQRVIAIGDYVAEDLEQMYGRARSTCSEDQFIYIQYKRKILLSDKNEIENNAFSPQKLNVCKNSSAVESTNNVQISKNAPISMERLAGTEPIEGTSVEAPSGIDLLLLIEIANGRISNYNDAALWVQKNYWFIRDYQGRDLNSEDSQSIVRSCLSNLFAHGLVDGILDSGQMFLAVIATRLGYIAADLPVKLDHIELIHDMSRFSDYSSLITDILQILRDIEKIDIDFLGKETANSLLNCDSLYGAGDSGLLSNMPPSYPLVRVAHRIITGLLNYFLMARYGCAWRVAQMAEETEAVLVRCETAAQAVVSGVKPVDASATHLFPENKGCITAGKLWITSSTFLSTPNNNEEDGAYLLIKLSICFALAPVASTEIRMKERAMELQTTTYTLIITDVIDGSVLYFRRCKAPGENKSTAYFRVELPNSCLQKVYKVRAILAGGTVCSAIANVNTNIPLKLSFESSRLSPPTALFALSANAWRRVNLLRLGCACHQQFKKRKNKNSCDIRKLVVVPSQLAANIPQQIVPTRSLAGISRKDLCIITYEELAEMIMNRHCAIPSWLHEMAAKGVVFVNAAWMVIHFACVRHTLDRCTEMGWSMAFARCRVSKYSYQRNVRSPTPFDYDLLRFERAENNLAYKDWCVATMYDNEQRWILDSACRHRKCTFISESTSASENANVSENHIYKNAYSLDPSDMNAIQNVATARDGPAKKTVMRMAVEIALRKGFIKIEAARALLNYSESVKQERLFNLRDIDFRFIKRTVRAFITESQNSGYVKSIACGVYVLQELRQAEDTVRSFPEVKRESYIYSNTHVGETLLMAPKIDVTLVNSQVVITVPADLDAATWVYIMSEARVAKAIAVRIRGKYVVPWQFDSRRDDNCLFIGHEYATRMLILRRELMK